MRLLTGALILAACSERHPDDVADAGPPPADAAPADADPSVAVVGLFPAVPSRAVRVSPVPL